MSDDERDYPVPGDDEEEEGGNVLAEFFGGFAEHMKQVNQDLADGKYKFFHTGDFGETIEVKEVVIQDNIFKPSFAGRRFCFVKVRPCDTEKWPDGTYVGILLGDMPLGSWHHMYVPSEKKLTITAHGNPAILVLDKKTGAPLDIVWGAGSWWGPINSPEDLEDITDEDIENVWYVQAIKAMAEAEKAKDEKQEEEVRAEEEKVEEPLPSWLEESAPPGDRERWEDVEISLRDKKDEMNFDFIHIWTGDDQFDNPTWTEFELEKTIVAVAKGGNGYNYTDVEKLPKDIRDQYKHRIAYLKLRTEGGNYSMSKYAPDTEDEALKAVGTIEALAEENEENEDEQGEGQ